MSRITIDWDLKEETADICEENCTGETYRVSGNWPSVIDDLCECLRNYLEGLDHERTDN